LKDSNAIKFDALSFDSAIEKNIKVMDTAAFALCRENNIRICVFSMFDDNYALANILNGQSIGTMVSQNGE
jgi:uridylate kinase